MQELFDEMVEVINPEACVIIHEWMELIEIFPFLQELELKVLQRKISIRVLSAVLGMNAKPFFCISKIIPTLFTTFASPVRAIVMCFFGIGNVLSYPVSAVFWITCTPSIGAYTIALVLCISQ